MMSMSVNSMLSVITANARSFCCQMKTLWMWLNACGKPAFPASGSPACMVSTFASSGLVTSQSERPPSPVSSLQSSLLPARTCPLKNFVFRSMTCAPSPGNDPSVESMKSTCLGFRGSLMSMTAKPASVQPSGSRTERYA